MNIGRCKNSRGLKGASAALTLMAILVGCGKGSVATSPAATPSSSSGTTTPASLAGTVNLAVTDAPSDNWAQVSVVLESASLLTQGSQAATPIWTASSTSPTVVNLVDLNNVATLLGSVSVPAGTYTTLQLVINPDPSTMTLVDDNGNTIPAANITVKGSGAINVSLAPVLVVTGGAASTLQADFNLADPLSISEVTLGGQQQVTLDLQVTHKPVPANPAGLPFTRKLGQVTATAAQGFTLTDSANNTFTYEVDASTIYADADTRGAGAFSGLSKGVHALVASNLNADGSFYARRVWYAASAATLPAWTPEGLVRRVDASNNDFVLFTAANAAATSNGPAWAPQTVAVDANTVWTYNTTVAMGTGTSFLADIWRGCRVDVVLNAAGTTATSVNVESAHDQGFIGSASNSSVTLGIPANAPPNAPANGAATAPAPPPLPPGVSNGPADLAPRTYTLAPTTFDWIYDGLPAGADTSAADLVTLVNAGQAAMLPVTGSVDLTWDPSSSAWQVTRLVLEPEPLHTSVITTAYVDGGSGSGTMAVTCLNPMNNFNASTATPLTITLDYPGDLQTVVSSTDFNAATNVVTFIAPVPAASWANLLVPPASATGSSAQIMVRPVISGSSVVWHATSVACFTGTAPAQATITSFVANPTTIQSGASATLTDVFVNGAGVINPGNLPVTSGTPVTVSPTHPTNYTLTVTDAHGNSVCQAAAINVGSGSAAPAITSFGAKPATIPAVTQTATVTVNPAS